MWHNVQKWTLNFQNWGFFHHDVCNNKKRPIRWNWADLIIFFMVFTLEGQRYLGNMIAAGLEKCLPSDVGSQPQFRLFLESNQFNTCIFCSLPFTSLICEIIGLAWFFVANFESRWDTAEQLLSRREWQRRQYGFLWKLWEPFWVSQNNITVTWRVILWQGS